MYNPNGNQIFFDGTALGGITTNYSGSSAQMQLNNSKLLRYIPSAGPVLRGTEDYIRGGNSPSDTFYQVVFTHQNAERYGRVNRNPSEVVSIPLNNPVKVYVLQDTELNIEQRTITFDAGPKNHYWDFMDQLGKVEATFIYAQRDEFGVEIPTTVDTKLKTINSRDPRLIVNESQRGAVLVENVVWTGSTGDGMKRMTGFWDDPENSDTYYVVYYDGYITTDDGQGVALVIK